MKESVNTLIGKPFNKQYTITSAKKRFIRKKNKYILYIQAEANEEETTQKFLDDKCQKLIGKQFFIYTIISAKYKNKRKNSIIYIKVQDDNGNIKEYSYSYFLKLIQQMNKNMNKAKSLINTQINDLTIIDVYYRIINSRVILCVKVKDENDNINEYKYSTLKNKRQKSNPNKAIYKKLINTKLGNYTIIATEYRIISGKKRLYVTVKDENNNEKELLYTMLKKMYNSDKKCKQLIGTKINDCKIINAYYNDKRLLYVTIQDKNNNVKDITYQNLKHKRTRQSAIKTSPRERYYTKRLEKLKHLIGTKIGIYTILDVHYQQLENDKKPILYIQVQNDNNTIKDYKYSHFNKEVKPKFDRINSLINKDINGYTIVSANYKDEGKRTNILYVQLKDENNRLYECKYGLLNQFINELQHCKEVIGKVAGRYTIIDAKYDQREGDARRAIYVIVKDNDNNISEYKYSKLMKKTVHKNKRLQNLIGKQYSKYTIIDAMYMPAAKNKQEVIFTTIRDNNGNISEMKYSELKSCAHQENLLNTTGHVTKARSKHLIGKAIDKYKIVSIRYEYNETYKQDVLYVTVQSDEGEKEYKYRDFQDLVKRNQRLKKVLNQVIGQYTIIFAEYKHIKDNKYALWVKIKDKNNIEYYIPYNNLLILNNKTEKLNELINQVINGYTIIKAEYKFTITCIKPFINVTLQKDNNIYECNYKHIHAFTKSAIIMNKMNDLVGKKFNKLTVIAVKYEKRGNRSSRIYCTCKCECGEICEYEYDLLRKHIVHSCSCGKYVDLNTLIGKQFDKYTIISAERKKKSHDKQNNIYVQVKDKDNNIKEYRYNYLQSKYKSI